LTVRSLSCSTTASWPILSACCSWPLISSFMRCTQTGGQQTHTAAQQGNTSQQTT
jgi:hypothetical protein